MEKTFEVDHRVRDTRSFIILLIIIIVLSSIFDISGVVYTIILGMALAFSFLFIYFYKIRKMRVNLLEDKMVFGRKIFHLSDVKKINLLQYDLKIIYGVDNSTFRYNCRFGTRKEVSEILSVYSCENNLQFFDLIQAATEREMVFDRDRFKEHYEKKHTFLANDYKRKGVIASIIIGGSILINAGLIMILDILTLIFDVSTSIEGIVISDLVPELSLLISACLMLALHVYWNALEYKIKERCEEQRQYFEGDTLKIEIFEKNAFEKYSVQREKVEKVLATDQYIEVYGKIDCEIHCSDGIGKKVVECVQILRCFSNEEQILNLGGK